ncbi:MFS transporter [Jiangella muralis]|uniref:MFS transporter n=1 Tax=Jiangella muralis TaxID=702383 RepID=UPI000AD91E69|nr:MFS transporter [Jiangella muralis]
MTGNATAANPAGQPTASGSGSMAGPVSRRWRMLALLGVAQLMVILDVTVVVIALPQLGADLGLSRSSLTWVVSAYTLTFGGLLLLGGRLSDLLGSRTVVLAGLGIFTAASLVIGLSDGPGSLIGGRAAQGLGAALLSPAALSLAVRLFDGEERTKALGIWSSLSGAGAALGVLLGGVLTAGPGWAWVFYVNVPIGVVLLLVLARWLGDDRPAAAGTRRLDPAGALLVTAAAASAAYGLTNAGEHGWLAVPTLLPATVAVALSLGFAAHQRAAAAPLIDPALLARRSVATGTFLIMVATALMISVFFLGTFALQHVRGYGALATSLMFLPVALGTVAGANLAARLVGSRGPGPVSAAGLLVAAAGTALPVVLAGTGVIVAGMSVAAVGLGAVFAGASTIALSRAGQHEAGIASGILSTFHEFGAALGVAATSSLAAASIAGTSRTGITHGLALASAVATVAAVVALLAIRNPTPVVRAACRTSVSRRRFVRHYLEMVIATAAGMVAIHPVLELATASSSR